MTLNTPTTPDPIFSNPQLAQIYDAFDPDRGDLTPYTNMVKDFKAKQVIDLGCGTGVLALLLAQEGVQVTGVDPAEASIYIAQAKPNADAVEWIVGDASVLPSASADAIVMTGNVAQAIVDEEAWVNTLSSSKRALVSGGHLVFETRRPDYQAWKEWNKEQSFKSIDIPNVGLVDGWVELTNVALPLVSFRHTYFFHEGNRTLTSDSTLRFRTLEEIKHDLETHGFTIEDIREAPDRPNKEFVVIARVTK